jgi:hypothetical protein
MGADPVGPDAGSEPAAGGQRLTVHVTIEPGEALSGSVFTDAEEPTIAFSGWLGLVEALNLFRRRAGQDLTPPTRPSSQIAPGRI